MTEPDDPRLRIALPRSPRDRASHDEPEAEPSKSVEVPARLVEPRRQTDRVWKPDPAQLDLDRSIADGSPDPLPGERQGQRRDRDAVRCLRGKREEQRAADGSIPPVTTSHDRMLAARERRSRAPDGGGVGAAR